MTEFTNLFDLREETGYAEFVEYFDPTPLYNGDGWLLMPDYDDWLDEEFDELFLHL